MHANDHARAVPFLCLPRVCSLQVEGRAPHWAGAPQQPEASEHHSLVRTLCDGGAQVAGAAALDALCPPGLQPCQSIADAGNPGLPGRAVFGAFGAVPALLAAQKASLGLAVDSNAEALVGAACTGCLAFRGSQGSLMAQGSGVDQPMPSLAAPVFIAHSADHLSRVCVWALHRCLLSSCVHFVGLAAQFDGLPRILVAASKPHLRSK